MRKTQEATLHNVIKLFSAKLKDFAGESRRSYQKAYSSIQIFALISYSSDDIFDQSVVEDWVIYNMVQGLSLKTISFYLDKISGLYSGVAFRLTGGKQAFMKEVKKKLKNFDFNPQIHQQMLHISQKMHELWIKSTIEKKSSGLLDEFLSFDPSRDVSKESLKYIWGCIALNAGVRASRIKGIIGLSPAKLRILDFCSSAQISSKEKTNIINQVKNSIQGENPQWFAMRLRPGVAYDDLLERFALLEDKVEVPELFYPCQEVTQKVGYKVVWKDKPVIRDIVFFRKRKSDIYSLFTKLYDLAWCYRDPGNVPGNYASIPDKAMDEFRKAIGVLSPDFEIITDSNDFKPGDEVIIIDSRYIEEKGRIIKPAETDKEGNKIYRVTLLNCNGRWDIGIDARLLKSIKK